MNKEEKQAMLALCTKLAEEAHERQTRRDGITPFIVHPKRVSRECPTFITKCVGVLHDIVEDTPVTLEDLEKQGVPGRIVRGVEAMTRRENDQEPYESYIERILANEDARIVKIADILDNMMDRVSFSKIRKYKRAIIMLAKPDL